MNHETAPRTGWQTLAELDLFAGADLENQVQTWMFETLRLLELQQDILNRLVRSAQEAIAGMKNAKGKEANAPLVHLRVYTSPEVPMKSGSRRNWGFFRMEKHGDKPAESERTSHLIEFFLYLEG